MQRIGEKYGQGKDSEDDQKRKKRYDNVADFVSERHDLPLKFHPAAIGAPWSFTP